MAQLFVSSQSYAADIKAEYSAKMYQLIKALYPKFHPGGWAVTPAGEVIVSERIKSWQRLSNVKTLLEIVGKLTLQNFHAKRAVNIFLVDLFSG